MAWKRWFTKRRLLVVAVVYVSCWLLTYFVGAAQVRREIIAGMPLRPFSAFSDVSFDDSHHVRPLYYCRVRAYAPFLVYADYGWSQSPAAGSGASEMHCWMFGATFRICELSNWIA
jgi:hypothetical protein